MPFHDSGTVRNFERVTSRAAFGCLYVFCSLGMYCVENLLCPLWCW